VRDVDEDEDDGYSGDDVESGELVRQSEHQHMMMMGDEDDEGEGENGDEDEEMIDEYEMQQQYAQDPDYFTQQQSKRLKSSSGVDLTNKIKFRPQLPAHSNKISHHLAIKQQQQQQYNPYSSPSASNTSHLFAQLNSAAAVAAAAANATNSASAGSKIFHVDAYCYLCKKEFCNKYFLRTHLANKHKV
jgi:hypothetical protein